MMHRNATHFCMLSLSSSLQPIRRAEAVRHNMLRRVLSTTTTSAEYYPHYEIRQTRWNDNDGFGHINNSIYYNFMDDAVNMQLIDRGIGKEYPRFIAENGIKFFRPIQFPSQVLVGLRVVKFGISSVTYDVGFFCENNKEAAASARGKFVHVYLDEETKRPKAIPEEARKVLQLLVLEE
mmetsp:Transcript_16158/g.23763  ORF Transcript_16158/g.23763 Transcript_16158/m.23763 type:complete len:179 (-) Transcript_16158:93-629(-)